MRSSSHDVDALLAALVDQVAEAVAERLKQRESQPADDGLRDEPSMAKWLDVSQPTLQRMRSAGEVPFVRLGRRVAYHPPTVLAALSTKGQRKKGGAE